MKKSDFQFNPYPFRYVAQYLDSQWQEKIEEMPNMGAEKEAQLSAKELKALVEKRSSLGDLPLVNYTNQYGMGCFEGIKAFPQKDGTYAIFRVDANAQRFYNSMQGLQMPPFPKERFVSAIIQILQGSIKLGYKPLYDPKWEEDNFASAKGIYIRPYTYSEGGIGVNLSEHPYVIIVTTEVGSYFDIIDCPSIVVSKASRATPNGTGWIKCAANYVIPSLEKNNAKKDGFIECLFLDAREQKYVEECSSCNIFFVLKNGSIITPSLNDTILPGITRDSIIALLKEEGTVVEERRISIEEVFDSAVECFSTGTAVGVSHFGLLSYNNREIKFADGTIGPIANKLKIKLKHIQHGIVPDTHNWLTKI